MNKPLSERITQGPWIVDLPNSSNGQLAIKTADKTNNVAIVFGLPMGEVGMANAELIALAPTLLAQCDALLAACKAALLRLDHHDAQSAPEAIQLRQAIAGAKKDGAL